jgi:phosphatidylserine/phosphatidylglycerophosphate/cardiolipin synthase-like enzyme
MKVRTYHNGDDVFIGWKPDGPIPKCRGFALIRRRNGVEVPVKTWVGFEDDEWEEGERRSSTDWPIQKYQWTDYMAAPGDTLQYRVVPMVGSDKKNLQPDEAAASAWTEKITLSAEVTPNMEAYFNRGIVAAQWVSRRLGVTAHDLKTAKLKKIISTPDDSFRNYLAGPMGARLFDILEEARKKKRHVYAVLYELDDPQLVAALKKLGKRAHIVLGNGSVEKKGQDQNEEARGKLKKTDLFHRMTSPRALAHNKFLIVCDSAKKPRWVWTGSQNWTKTGLCTQANNTIYVDDRGLAAKYREQWDRLRDAGDATPEDLKTSNTKPLKETTGKVDTRLWFTPTVGQVDLKEAKKKILDAKQAILFLMFNPGPSDSLLNSIIDKARKGSTGKRLYIHGAINQDPSTTKNPVKLFDESNWEKADYDVVLPAAIDEPTKFFVREMKKLPGAWAMVHSKVVLIDPFGKHPILLTGSHNLGPRASGTNDENLLIIEDAPGLAAAYAANIMAIYNQYRWRFRRQVQPPKKRWKGLKDNATWQDGYLKPGSRALREIDFWVGE